MTAPIATLDPDVAFPNRKPQFATDFDPRWQVSLYQGCGAGPYGLAPYIGRGFVPAMSLGGAAAIIAAQDGWAAKASAGGASDYYGATGAAITWAPSQTLGSCVFAFRAAAASTDSASRIFISYGDSAGGGAYEYFFFTGSGSALFAGWEGNLTASTVGLWAAGQLVVVVMTYSSAGPQALYVNGALIATSSATPAIGSYTGNANNSVSIAGLPGTANGCEAPILYALFADRAFTAEEIAWIAANPLNWMFLPGPISAALGSGISLVSLAMAMLGAAHVAGTAPQASAAMTSRAAGANRAKAPAAATSTLAARVAASAEGRETIAAAAALAGRFAGAGRAQPKGTANTILAGRVASATQSRGMVGVHATLAGCVSAASQIQPKLAATAPLALFSAAIAGVFKGRAATAVTTSLAAHVGGATRARSSPSAITLLASRFAGAARATSKAAGTVALAVRVVAVVVARSAIVLTIPARVRRVVIFMRGRIGS